MSQKQIEELLIKAIKKEVYGLCPLTTYNIKCIAKFLSDNGCVVRKKEKYIGSKTMVELTGKYTGDAGRGISKLLRKKKKSP